MTLRPRSSRTRDGSRADAGLDGRRGAAATRETGEAWFWSRSRPELWHKGETSGNTLAVEELRDDCDGDALLLRVRPAGPACHTGSLSCFAPGLWRTIAERARTARGLVRRRLLDAGPARPRARSPRRASRSRSRRRRERRARRRGGRRRPLPRLRRARVARARPGRGRGRAARARVRAVNLNPIRRRF